MVQQGHKDHKDPQVPLDLVQRAEVLETLALQETLVLLEMQRFLQELVVLEIQALMELLALL